MPAGTATLNFGAFPGSVEAEVDVTGQTGFVAASQVEAWVLPIATADHSADEHMAERIRVTAVYKVNGTLTIRGFNNDSPVFRADNRCGAQPQRLWGQWSIGWAWKA